MEDLKLNMEKCFLENCPMGYYSGTSGLLLPVKNKLFYPDEFKETSRLHFYGSMMNSIEVNSSFYKVPMGTTVSKWTNDVPEGFKFTFKLYKGITHNKGLAFDPEMVRNFFSVINHVGEKTGALLVQFPSSVRIAQFRQLEMLIQTLREANPENKWNIAMEFRHVSWYQHEVYQLLEDNGVGIVLHDKPPAVTPMIDLKTGFVYLRFHGPQGSYRGTYEEHILEEYASYIDHWVDEGKRVYAYFNNTMGSAVANLFTLRDLVFKRGKDQAGENA